MFKTLAFLTEGNKGENGDFEDSWNGGKDAGED